MASLPDPTRRVQRHERRLSDTQRQDQNRHQSKVESSRAPAQLPLLDVDLCMSRINNTVHRGLQLDPHDPHDIDVSMLISSLESRLRLQVEESRRPS